MGFCQCSSAVRESWMDLCRPGSGPLDGSITRGEKVGILLVGRTEARVSEELPS
jgi:hypothetical protein